MKRLFDWAGVLFASTISLLAFIGVLLFLRAFGEPLWTQEASGWAQAIGAVVAIFASFALFQRQREHELQESRDADLRRRFVAVQTVIDVAYRAIAAIENVFEIYECDFAHGITPNMRHRLPELRAILDHFADPTADRIFVLAALTFSTALAETESDIAVGNPELKDHVTGRLKKRVDDLWAMADRLVSHMRKLEEQCRQRGIDMADDVEPIVAGE